MSLLKLLPLAFVLWLGAATGPATARTLNGDFAFPDGDIALYEGDECELTKKPLRTGICRKATECPLSAGRNAVHCEIGVRDAVVCCPTAGGTGVSANRFTSIAKQECDAFLSRSSDLTVYLSVNRKEASLGEFPFMASINFEGDDVGEIGCGAALISKRFLVTAAHCFGSFKPVSVTLGTIRKDDPEANVYRVKEVHIHENYKRRQNDLALLELDTDVAEDPYIGPICLNSEMEIDSSTNLTVMGWGRDGNGAWTNRLYKGIVRMVNEDLCKEKYNEARLTVQLNEKILCALGEKSAVSNEYTDACEGDSGGPLIMTVRGKFYLVGVISFGTSCGGTIPGIYSQISQHIDWIERKVWGGQ
ncbi:AGAP000573-PA-like protein [Anopheles sinensis]|uniref:AGAP000573-PA-like protein n=1 Tax=Anopheles sinensis TaxID=74873 RepID=A0A084VAA3_ANOSI|nr:AGAP000573-PA-like protein [Anopheles sinensis]